AATNHEVAVRHAELPVQAPDPLLGFLRLKAAADHDTDEERVVLRQLDRDQVATLDRLVPPLASAVDALAAEALRCDGEAGRFVVDVEVLRKGGAGWGAALGWAGGRRCACGFLLSGGECVALLRLRGDQAVVLLARERGRAESFGPRLTRRADAPEIDD